MPDSLPQDSHPSQDSGKPLISHYHSAEMDIPATSSKFYNCCSKNLSFGIQFKETLTIPGPFVVNEMNYQPKGQRCELVEQVISKAISQTACVSAKSML
jgi:hypothetical protein